jgi:predicted Zn-ribbon and HTH transcriptional regulator
MSFVQRTVAHCDQCGHEWIIVAESLPTHCAKCKSRQWNAGEKIKPKPVLVH